MKQEKESLIASLKLKLNNLVTKHQQKKDEIDNKSNQIQSDIKAISTHLVNSLNGQQFELNHSLFETDHHLESKLDDIKSKQETIKLKLNELKNKQNSNGSLDVNDKETLIDQIKQQIAELKIINFTTEFKQETGLHLKIGEITPVEQVNTIH